LVKNKKITIITQARLGSSRFPNKILKTINGKTLIEFHLLGLKKVRNIDNIIVATTMEDKIDKLLDIVKGLKIKYYQGSTNNVLERFFYSVSEIESDYIVRVTSDCPLLDPALIEEVVDFTVKNKLDYCSNILEENYPDGQDIEVFTYQSLKYTHDNAKLDYDKEHVTTYIRRNSSYLGGNLFISDNFKCNFNYNHVRMTVDEPNDYKAIKTLILNVGENKSWLDYTNFIINNKDKFKNQNILRNEGYLNSIK